MRVGNFEVEWEVDFLNEVVRRKPRNWKKCLQDFFNRPRFKLSEFHRYIRSQEGSVNGMPFPTILDSDAMTAVEGVPKKLKLLKAWVIPVEDLKVLYGDNYVLIDDESLLVACGKPNKLFSSVEVKPGAFGVSIDLKKLCSRK